MANARGSRSLRSDKHEDPLQRLLRSLPQKHLAVLESLPPADSYDFQPAQKFGNAAIKIYLGDRPRLNGTSCQTWAYILPDKPDLKPPVVFRYKTSSIDGRCFLYPLSATALLRRATHLKEPFCFLQHDPADEVKNARNMLCAIILLQALVKGVAKCALQWEHCGDSLSLAIDFIQSRDAYHQWQHKRQIVAVSRPQLHVTQAEGGKGSDRVSARIADGEAPRSTGTISGVNFAGGVVRPGQNTLIRPNTSLARLRVELGEKKFHLLDLMPRLSMSLASHDLGPKYFPFRMLIGSHRWRNGKPFSVYAYLEHDRTKNAVLRFMSSNSTGQTQTFTVDELLDITLLQPLEYLNNYRDKGYVGAGSSARTAKIRSVISYYFFLAENEGLVGDPKVKIGESFGKRLCAAVKEMQYANLGDTDTVASKTRGDSQDDDTDIDVPPSKSMQPTDREEECDTQPARTKNSILRSGTTRTFKRDERDHIKQQRDNRRMQNYGEHVDPRGSPAEGSVAEHAPTLQLDFSPSPQGIHECLTATPIHQDNTFQSCVDTSGANTVRDTEDADACTRYMIVSRTSLVTDSDQFSDKEGKASMTTAKKEDFDTRPHDETQDLDQREQSTQKPSTVDHASAGSEVTKRSSLAGNSTKNPSAAVGQDRHNHDDVQLGDSPPYSARSSSWTSCARITEGKDRSESHDPIRSSENANIHVAKVLDNEPPTPERSAERELRPREVTSDTTNLSRCFPETIDLCSDDDDFATTLRMPKIQSGQSPEAWQEFLGLTRSSPRPRGKKRKSSEMVHFIESDDEIIEETNGDAHRKAQLRRL